jgi:hypothetical protein
MMTTDQIAAGRLSSPVQPDVTGILSRVTDLEQRASTLIRQRPVVAVLAAVGVGYLIARLVSRGTR